MLREQMIFLLEQGLHDSAEMLGNFLMSLVSTNAELSPASRAESVILFGDALYGRKEYRRALHVFRQALQLCRATPKQPMSGTRTPVLSRPSSAASTPHDSKINENEVKYKIGLCYLAVHDTRAALSEMEGIPSKARTLRMNLTLAKLYRMTGYDRVATASYRECLRQCPYVLEAIVALAELGIPSKDIHSLFPQGPGKTGRSTTDHLEPVRWLQRFADGHSSIAAHDYKGALENFNSLGQRFPNNLHLLLESAKAEMTIMKNDEAAHSFEKARQIDQFNISSLDEYAMLLRTRGEQLNLNRLVHELINVDATRPEVWVAAAVYWEMRDDKIRALSYADKGMRVDERHTSAYIVKGNICLTLNRPEAAVMAFRKAQQLKPDLRSYQGLVRSYLAIPKHKEALYAAREAVKAMPQSAKALTLVGDVYAHHPDGRDKARRFYESALRLEPTYLGAVLALAELYGMEGRNEEAILLLQRYLKTWADDGLYTKLAQILAASNKLGDSLFHYQSALSINPENDAAKKGLERLEKQMKGVDPDAIEEEEENEGEDVDAEAEEGEFL